MAEPVPVYPTIGHVGIGVSPYGDIGEIPAPRTVTPLVDPYREFLPTDARTIMIVLQPNHYNFIPNPAFRVDTAGWELTAAAPTGSNLVTMNVASGTDDLGTTAGFKTGQPGTSTWSTGAISSSTAQFKSGLKSLAFTTTATADQMVSFVPSTTVTTFPVVKPSTQYTFQFAAFTSAAETMGIRVQWYKSNSAGSTTLSNTSAFTATTANTWKTYTFTVTSPSDAAYAGFGLHRPTGASGVQYNLDEVGYWEGTGTTWVLPVNPTFVLDPSDSWVGQSVMTQGTGLLRYLDKDNLGASAPVYVGPSRDILDMDWYEPGRAAAAWTMSAYLKGIGAVNPNYPARARLVMYAYLPTEVGKYKSPPLNYTLPLVIDPLTASWGAAIVKDSDGTVWNREELPQYDLLGKPPESLVAPLTILTANAFMDALLRKESDGSVWEKMGAFPSAAPYYTTAGVPPSVADPAVSANVGKYVQRSADNLLWQWITSKYEIVQPQPKVVDDPAVEIPDATRLEPYLMYQNNLYGVISPVATSPVAPYYELLGTPTVTALDPATMAPAAQYYLVTRAAVDGILPTENGQVWQLRPPPYYVADNDGTGAMQIVEGPWHEFNEDEWVRLTTHTSAREEGDGRVSFLGAYWIDARVEIENMAGIRVSAVMLDPTEEPIAAYFDGSMTEDASTDDFMWSAKNPTTGAVLANNCVSYYYYDRAVRVRWLEENLRYVVPVDRPYQIFFGAYDFPHIPVVMRARSREVAL